jgi:putative glutathione S-transferase
VNQLVDGEWRTDVYETTNDDGEFDRQETSFRDWIEADPDAEFPAEAGRYHLYVSYACPWAHRTLVTRALRGLDDAISVDVVDPYRDDDGWQFTPDREGATPDSQNGFDYLRETYVAADPDFTGRVTVPVLWDKEQETIVNNESEEVMRILDTAFEEYANDATLYPEGRQEAIDETIDAIYDPVNNGVYRASLAETQDAYGNAVADLFDALDHWEAVLDGQRYLCGDTLTEADVCMFTTLVRFDDVYYTTPDTAPAVHSDVTDGLDSHWKRIADYPNLSAYMRDIYQQSGVAETVDIDHITDHYGSPGSPAGFDPAHVTDATHDFDAPHDRDELSEAALAR